MQAAGSKEGAGASSSTIFAHVFQKSRVPKMKCGHTGRNLHNRRASKRQAEDTKNMIKGDEGRKKASSLVVALQPKSQDL
jgi:hypothetical protein